MEYDFEFQYKKESEKKAADFLSRSMKVGSGGEVDDKGELTCAMIVQEEDCTKLRGTE